MSIDKKVKTKMGSKFRKSSQAHVSRNEMTQIRG